MTDLGGQTQQQKDADLLAILPFPALAKLAIAFTGFRGNKARQLPGNSQIKAYSACGAVKMAINSQSPGAELLRVWPIAKVNFYRVDAPEFTSV